MMITAINDDFSQDATSYEKFKFLLSICFRRTSQELKMIKFRLGRRCSLKLSKRDRIIVLGVYIITLGLSELRFGIGYFHQNADPG